MKRSHAYLMGILLVGLTSCFEKETPIDPYPRGDVEEFLIAMGHEYNDQVFYSFDQNMAVKSVKRTDWDMAFNTNANNNTIYLNTGNALYAARTNVSDLRSIKDTSGLEFKWDWDNGKDDSTALVGWEKENVVYVIDLGLDLSDEHRGFVKVKFEMDGTSLKATYAFIDQTESKTVTLDKNSDYHRVYFSFVEGQQVDIEPLKTTYDLVFRKYIFYFNEEKIPYNVVGALMSHGGVQAMSISDKDFADITIADTSNYNFSTDKDVVGYDWKEFNLNEGFYVVYPEKNFIIKTENGFIYKFHFVDFYNEQGDRGYPTIEMKLL